MALSVVNNGASLNAQQNLGRTSSALSKSLERLSTGLKINRGADGPAGLVISEQQRAQISGLKTAIDNTNKAVSLAQTGEGALNEINTLLNKVRSLALDSANSGVNEASALAANQAEIANALSTINNIANTTKYGSGKFLLNGDAGNVASVAVNNSNIGQLTAGIDATSTTSALQFNIGGANGGLNTATSAASVTPADFTAIASGTFNLTVSGGGLAGNVVVDVAGTTSAADIVTRIQDRLNTVAGSGAFTVDTTTVAGSITVRSNISASVVQVASNVAATATASGFATTSNAGTAGAALTGLNVANGRATGGTTAGAAAAAGAGVLLSSFSATTSGTLTITQADATGVQDLTGTISVGLVGTDTRDTAVAKIQAQLDAATANNGGPGKFNVAIDSSGYLTISSNVLGSGALTITASNAGVQSLTGVSTGGDVGASGNALRVYQGSGSTLAGTVSAGDSGLYNAVDYNGASGVSFSVGVTSGKATSGQNNVDIVANALTFQIGANAGETTKLSIDKVSADRLGTGATDLDTAAASLADIDVTTAAGAQDALKIIDAAIDDVSNLRAKLGAFQTNTLESNANNLRNTLENTIAAESVIRDTDFASEISNFTRLQTQQQAGATVLGNANQTTALVAQLLRG